MSAGQRTVIAVAQACCALALLTWTIARVDVAQLRRSLDISLRAWPLLVAAVLASGISVLAAAARWKCVLDAMESPQRLPKLIYIHSWTVIINRVVPSSLFGDAFRGWSLRQRGHPLTIGFAAVFIDRLIGGLVLAAVAVCMAAVNGSVPLQFVAIALIGGVGAVVLAGALVRRPWPNLPTRRWTPFVRSVGAVVRRLTTNRRRLVSAIIWSLVIQAAFVMQYVALSIAAGLSIAPLRVGMLVPIVQFLASVPITFGGAGVREATLVLLGERHGLRPSDAVLLSALSLVTEAICVGVAIALTQRTAKEEVPAERPGPHSARTADRS